jgi:Tfp pilus assembly PilM family ATPase
MAHTITGIDLGSWSVKFTVLEVGFRHTRVVASYEEKVAVDERPLAERQSEALKSGTARLPGGTTIYVALTGETLTLRALDLPFADARKIEQIVGYEMEGQMIHDLHDVILDHVVLSSRGQVAEGNEGCRALVVAARTEDIGAFLAGLQACNADPRSIFVAPLLYRPREPAVSDGDGPAGCQVIVDIGHRHTNLCFVVGDEAVFARTLLRGGEEISKALQRASNGTWNWDQTELGKAQMGFVASRARPAATPLETRVDAIVREALQPLLRDLRQTLASFSIKDKAPIEGLLLAGGGARLRGLAEFLQDELAIPVRPLVAAPEFREGPDGEPIEVEPTDPDADRFVLVNAIAKAGARGQKELELRRGVFQYRANFSVVRQRAGHLAILAASLIVCAGIFATITLRRLSTEQRVLKAQLQTATKEIFGEARMEATDVTAALKRSFRDEMAPLPKATAFDLLDDISTHMPPNAEVQVDIEDLDIRAKKTLIKGTVDSAATVEEIVTKLKEIECFEEISKGPITEVSGGAKQFSLTIASKCP